MAACCMLGGNFAILERSPQTSADRLAHRRKVYTMYAESMGSGASLFSNLCNITGTRSAQRQRNGKR